MRPTTDVELQQTQRIRAKDRTDRDEHDRAADPRPLDPAGDRAVDQKKSGQEGGILVHLNWVSAETIGACVSIPEDGRHEQSNVQHEA